MTPAEQTYRRARSAVERVLDANRERSIEIDEFLRAAPEISWRALEDALARLVGEKRLVVIGRLPGRRERITRVVDRLVFEEAQEANRQSERASLERSLVAQREHDARRAAARAAAAAEAHS